MKLLKFRNGDTMPILGLGTWKAKGDEVKNAVKTAINVGYRHIDTASIYGNEAEIGEALQELFNDGIVNRKDLFITTKLWNDAHKAEDVKPALKESLKKLKLDYIDLYLIHWPVAFKSGVPMPAGASDFVSLDDLPLSETWNEMIKLKKEGLAKHIGVSNFSIKKLKEIINKTEEVPEVNQVELHPFLQQNELLAFSKKNNIHLTGYSPLGSGDRAEAMKAENEPNLFDIPEIKNIAKKHQVHPAQVLVNWHIQRDVAVIPKSVTPKNIESNLKATSLQLDESDMKLISRLDKHFRYVTGNFFLMPEKGYNTIYDE